MVKQFQAVFQIQELFSWRRRRRWFSAPPGPGGQGGGGGRNQSGQANTGGGGGGTSPGQGSGGSGGSGRVIVREVAVDIDAPPASGVWSSNDVYFWVKQGLWYN